VRVTTLFSMRGLAVLVGATALITSAAQAQEPQPAQQPKEHVVRKGDTLWDLARAYLNDPYRWPLIYDANRDVVKNPHWIYPAEKLIIPGLTQPVPVAVTADTVPMIAVADAAPEPPGRSLFYREAEPPREPTVLSSETQRDAIIRPQEWLAAAWLGDTVGLSINGRVISSIEERNADDKLPQQFHPRNEVYISAPGRVGDRLLVVRLARSIGSYGWVIQPKGVLRIDTVGGNVARARIMQQFADLKEGDLTMPLPAVPTIATVEPRRVTGGATGKIIDFIDKQDIYGTTDIAFIDLGTARGINIGDEVVAFLPERRADEYSSRKLPEEPVAQMRIIKLTNNTATVRVTRLHNPSLERKLPVRVSRQQSP
jgi:hypothetical protein